jgi:phage terminase large subunit
LRANGAIDVAPDLEQDLIGPDFWHDPQDRLVLESKESMKDRGLDSPDDADALALTFAAEVKAPRKGEVYDREEFEIGYHELDWMGS